MKSIFCTSLSVNAFLRCMLVIGVVFFGTSKSSAVLMMQDSVFHSTAQNTVDLQPSEGMEHSAACIVVCVGAEAKPHFEIPKQVDFLSFLVPALRTLQLDGRIPPPAKQPPKPILIV